jgi:hypothetical protein
MSLDDDRIRFYFKHREQIEQWAALRTEAAAAVDEWMEQLGRPLEALASELGPDVRVVVITAPEAAYPSFRLVREAWGLDAAGPLACVALEWVRGRTTMRGGQTPYVGLRSWKGREMGIKLRAMEDLKKVRLKRKDKLSEYWPGYAYVAPIGAFPEASETYRDELVAAVRNAWEAYAGFVDLAVREA